MLGKHPDAEHTIKNVDAYEEVMEDLRGSIIPELELIEARITGPTKELQVVLKSIRKSITKREHKVRLYHMCCVSILHVTLILSCLILTAITIR